MEYRRLGKTELKVSALCLGTMTWGQQNTEAEGHEQMDYALDQGINFFDTAELYPIPPKAETQGRTEEIIGSWFASRRNRDKVILATKVIGRTKMNWFRKDGSPGELSPAQIREAVEGSLRRLRTDYIDLYQVHWPDRPEIQFGFNPVIYKEVPEDPDHPPHPIAETLMVLDSLVQEGKVRYVGVSNESAWGTMSYLHAAETRGLTRIQSIQNAYNLLNRTAETALAELCRKEQVSFLAYSPLAQGYLTGKYEGGALPPCSRKTLFNRLNRYETPGAPAAISAYLALAREFSLDPAQMAIQFVTTRPFITANIIGATSMDQLKTDIASQDLPMTEELEARINAIHLTHTNPCP